MPAPRFYKILGLATLVFTFVWPFRTEAGDCVLPRPAKTSGKSVVLLPFSPTSNDLHATLPALIADYLSLMKGVEVRFSEKSSPGDIVLSGRILPEGVEITMARPSGPSEVLKGRIESTGVQDVNNAAVAWAITLSERLGSGLKEKKILPYLRLAASPATYPAYARGRLLLDEPDSATISDAVSAFERSLQNDYNFVPAYLGLAEALAARAVLTGSAADRKKASIEFEKAKLLHPPLAEEAEGRIRDYLKRKEPSCGGKS